MNNAQDNYVMSLALADMPTRPRRPRMANAQIKQRGKAKLAEMRAAGVSVSQWARDNGFSRDVVNGVLYGRSACLSGIAHEVSVALGIKEGVVVKPGTYRPRAKPVDGRALQGAA
jgi:gp16 family phage-associated protein